MTRLADVDILKICIQDYMLLGFRPLKLEKQECTCILKTHLPLEPMIDLQQKLELQPIFRVTRLVY